MLKLNKIKFITTLLGLLLLSQVTASPNPGTAGGGEHPMGPATIGMLTITDMDLGNPENVRTVSLSGNCKGKPINPIVEVNDGGDNNTINEAADLVDIRLLGPTFSCTDEVLGTFVVQTVLEFNRTDTYVEATATTMSVISAKVITLFVVNS